MAERDEFDDEWSKITGELEAEDSDEELGDELEKKEEVAEGAESAEAEGSDEGESDDKDEEKVDNVEEGVDKTDGSADNKDDGESVEDELAAIQQKNKDLELRVSSERGRQVAMQRELRKSRERIEELQAKLDAGAPEELPEDWKEIEEKFPLLAKALQAKSEQDRKRLETQIAELRAENIKLANVSKQKENEAYLDAHNPGWKDTVNTEGFQKWLGSQTELIKNLFESEDVRDNSELLRLYSSSFPSSPADKPAAAVKSEDTSSAESRRQKQLESGARIPSSSVDVEELEDDDFDSAFAQAAKKEDRTLGKRY